MRRDELLCYCDGVSHRDFRDVILADPEKRFDEACSAARIGAQCTACLLNAEHFYIETLAIADPVIRTSNARARERMLPSRKEIYALIDRLSPRLPHRTEVNMPVLFGPGVRSIASIANSVSKEVRGRPASVRVDLRITDDRGHVVQRVRRTLMAGDRLDHEIGNAIEGGEIGLAVGTCWVKTTPLERSYNGTIRPHFKVLTSRGVSSLHSQGSGRRESFHASLNRNSRERQFIALTNAGRREATAEINVRRSGSNDPLHTVRRRVVSHGTALAELPPMGDSEMPLLIHTRADEPLRYHFVVASEGNARISVDHI